MKYFITVAQTQHMTTAAQQLNITQPSLSAAIRRLEADIGFQLFDRVGRGIQLNENGKLFLDAVTEIDTILNTCLTELEARKQSSVSFVRIACSISPTNSRLIDMLLSKGLNLKVGNIPNNWEQELMNHNSDLVITMGVSHNPSIDHTVLRAQKAVIVSSTAHPLAAAEAVTSEDLVHDPFCSTSAPHSLSNMAHEKLKAYGLSPRITFLCRDSADMTKALRSGKYLGFMGRHNLAYAEDLTILPLENLEVSLPISLYWRKSDARNPALSAMRQSIIDFYLGLPAV